MNEIKQWVESIEDSCYNVRHPINIPFRSNGMNITSLTQRDRFVYSFVVNIKDGKPIWNHDSVRLFIEADIKEKLT